MARITKKMIDRYHSLKAREAELRKQLKDLDGKRNELESLTETLTKGCEAAGGDVTTCGHRVYFTYRTNVPWKKHFVEALGEAKAAEISEDSPKTAYLKVD